MLQQHNGMHTAARRVTSQRVELMRVMLGTIPGRETIAGGKTLYREELPREILLDKGLQLSLAVLFW